MVCASNRPPHAATLRMFAQYIRQRLQVRVMPRCWLVLLRFWLRVDRVLVRLRETRYFCDTAAAPATVLREVKHSEGTFAELRAGGAPPEGVRLRVSHAVLTDGCPRTVEAFMLPAAQSQCICSRSLPVLPARSRLRQVRCYVCSSCVALTDLLVCCLAAGIR